MYKAIIPFESLSKNVIAAAATEKDITRGRLELEIPEKNLIAAVWPKEPAPVVNVPEAVRKALENPVAGPKFSSILGPEKSIAIITDNQFRATPTHKYLSTILDMIEKTGAKEGCLAIGGMMVSHAVPMSEDDIKQKLGAENLERLEDMGFEVFQNEPMNPEANVFIGFTNSGTPVWLNKKVAKCDIKFGLPLTQSEQLGYGGGTKLALAMSSVETIEVCHQRCIPLSPTSHPGAATGAMRKDIDEIAELARYEYALCSILDSKFGISDLTYGKLPESWRASLEKYNQVYGYDVPGIRDRKADIVIAGSPAPHDHLLFHTGWGLPNADFVCRDGGTIIFCSPCPGYRGAPGFNFLDLMKPYMPVTPENFERLIRDIVAGREGAVRKVSMWHGCIWVPWYEMMMRKHITIVTIKENLAMGRDVGLDVTDSLQEAYDQAMKRHGPNAKILILPYLRFQIPAWAIKT